MLTSSYPIRLRRIHVQTHKIQIFNGRKRVFEIRRELFAFPEIMEVFITSRPDALVVVCSGRPRPAEWLRALREAGYDAVVRRRPTTRLPGSERELQPPHEAQGEAKSLLRGPRIQRWAPTRTRLGTLEHSAELG
jgi:hypothetical protein